MSMEKVNAFAATRKKYLVDGRGERWTETKTGGARRGIAGGWATVYKHRPTSDEDKRQGYNFCLMFVNCLLYTSEAETVAIEGVRSSIDW